MRGEIAHGFARLHEERLVATERAQRGHDAVIGLPAPRGLARAAVHDEILPALGHVRVEVVHEHTERRFLRPALAGERAAARSADRLVGAAGGQAAARHGVSSWIEGSNGGEAACRRHRTVGYLATQWRASNA